MRVLVAEDERSMAATLKRALEEENHAVTVAFDGLEAIDIARLYDFDVIVLDVMLPQIDGFEVARRLRKGDHDIPIVMLTARDATSDIVRGLDVGADDYLTKPFSLDELMARLRAAVRHRPASRTNQLQLGDLVVDPASRRVSRSEGEIHLSNTEYRLLEFLLLRAGRIVNRTALIEGVWGFDHEIEENTLDAFMHLLRQKIDRGAKRKLIHTVRGVGYCLREGE